MLPARSSLGKLFGDLIERVRFAKDFGRRPKSLASQSKIGIIPLHP
jgi:hypothetical protein